VRGLTTDDRIAVLFLARGIGGGVAAAQAFLASLAAHPAGAPHDLVLLRKGFTDDAEAAEVARLADRHGARVIDLPDDGYDWGAYLRAAAQLPHGWVYLLNTHSRMLRAGWLHAAAEAAGATGVGAVGCTGSWQSLAPGLRFVLPLARWVGANRTPLHGLAEAAQQLWAVALGRQHPRGRDFPGFPNPHLRSNALLLRRTDLLQFGQGHALPQDKHAACLLESGRRGLSRYLLQRGLALRLVGADGSVHGPEAWDASGTFRTPGQPNLLVGDNQTRAYDSGTLRERQFLELISWGRTVSA
jgi:hypothetical protein